jgi:hypothetical protein
VKINSMRCGENHTGYSGPASGCMLLPRHRKPTKSQEKLNEATSCGRLLTKLASIPVPLHECLLLSRHITIIDRPYLKATALVHKLESNVVSCNQQNVQVELL